MYRLRVPAVPASLVALNAFAGAVTAELGLNPQEAYRLRLLLDELASNIVHHAAHTDGMLNVAFTAATNGVRVVIEDDGLPFDVSGAAATAPTPGLPLDQRPTGGLGLYLVRLYAHDLHYERDTTHHLNRVTFTARR